MICEHCVNAKADLHVAIVVAVNVLYSVKNTLKKETGRLFI